MVMPSLIACVPARLGVDWRERRRAERKRGFPLALVVLDSEAVAFYLYLLADGQHTRPLRNDPNSFPVERRTWVAPTGFKVSGKPLASGWRGRGLRTAIPLTAPLCGLCSVSAKEMGRVPGAPATLILVGKKTS